MCSAKACPKRIPRLIKTAVTYLKRSPRLFETAMLLQRERFDFRRMNLSLSMGLVSRIWMICLLRLMERMVTIADFDFKLEMVLADCEPHACL